MVPISFEFSNLVQLFKMLKCNYYDILVFLPSSDFQKFSMSHPSMYFSGSCSNQPIIDTSGSWHTICISIQYFYLFNGRAYFCDLGAKWIELCCYLNHIYYLGNHVSSILNIIRIWLPTRFQCPLEPPLLKTLRQNRFT